MSQDNTEGRVIFVPMKVFQASGLQQHLERWPAGIMTLSSHGLH